MNKTSRKNIHAQNHRGCKSVGHCLNLSFNQKMHRIAAIPEFLLLEIYIISFCYQLQRMQALNIVHIQRLRACGFLDKIPVFFVL